jgi:GntR family transcriptional regulator
VQARSKVDRLELELRADEILYRQIERALEHRIASGELSPGTLIPSETRLAAELGVARGTVRKAIEGLVAKGLLERRRGKGTWVPSFLIDHLLGKISSFSEDMRMRGIVPGSRLLMLEKVPVPLFMQGLLGIGEGPVWRLTRLRTADGVPIAVEVCHVPAALFEQHELEVAMAGSLYAAFRDLGRPPFRARQAVEAINVRAREADLLGLPAGTACFRQERVTYDRRGEVLEVVESTYRADVYRLHVELRLSP